MESNGHASADMELREWLSLEELAEILQVTVAALRGWLGRGEFPPYTRLPNNRIRVHRDDFEVWMLRRRVAS